MLKGYAKRIDTESLDDLCYDYEDDWKEEMESYQQAIAEQVEELKKR